MPKFEFATPRGIFRTDTLGLIVQKRIIKEMTDIKIVPATLQDRDPLADLFLTHISQHTEYISHGEIQMGVGVGTVKDGELVTGLSPRAREMWLKYITANLSCTDGTAAVYKAVCGEGELLAGFCVVNIMEDGADPFGMVCDVLVDESFRGRGVGGMLLREGISYLRGHGVVDIYLESGRNNHSAHEFFQKRGFHHVSEIFKLENN